MRLSKLFMILILLVITSPVAFSQDDLQFMKQPTDLPDKFFEKMDREASSLEDRMTSTSTKALARLSKLEARLKRKIYKRDSIAAVRIFSGTEKKYSSLTHKIQYEDGQVTQLSSYVPHLDSVATGLKFITATKNLPSGTSVSVRSALSSIQRLEGKFQQVEEIKQFVHQRRQQLKEQLQEYGLKREWRKYDRQAYYYVTQMQDYKAVLNDPDKLGKKALLLLQKVPAFQDFMQRNSALAALFPLPAGNETAQPLQGLQTRSQLQGLLQSRLAVGGPNAAQVLQQNIQQAQAQLNQLKDKISNLGGGSGDIEIPDFKPNSQHTKAFLQRLEYGVNLQSQRSNGYFPTATDIGLSLGYKLNDISTAGIGLCYKMGWGKDISHIRVSGEGISLRSFLDVKLRGSFYLSGGFEYLYQQPFTTSQQISKLYDWQRSGLIGLSKTVSMNTRFFKKTKVQLLWDFLSYQQRPQGRPIKVRIGYVF